MAAETLAIEEFLYSKLSADSALITALGGTAIYSYQAPENVSHPYVIFGLQSGTDEWTMSGSRAAADCLYRVLVVGQGESFNALRTAANRIDTVLNDASGTTALTEGRIIFCQRVQSLQYVEVLDGVRWLYIGGLYRLIA